MLFEKELAKLRQIYNVKTISIHNGTLIKGMNAATIPDIIMEYNLRAMGEQGLMEKYNISLYLST